MRATRPSLFEFIVLYFVLSSILLNLIHVILMSFLSWRLAFYIEILILSDYNKRNDELAEISQRITIW